MPRVSHPTAQCNAKILNKARIERTKRSATAAAANIPVYAGPIDDSAMEIRQGEIVVRLPDGSVTSALNGCPLSYTDTASNRVLPQAYPILGVAIAAAAPNPAPSSNDPHTMVNVGVAGSLVVRNVGTTTFHGGDEVFAVFPAPKGGESAIRTGRGRDSSQVQLFNLVKGTSRKPILDAILHNAKVREFWDNSYEKLRKMTLSNSSKSYAPTLKLLTGPNRLTVKATDKDVKLLLKQLKQIIELLRVFLTMARGYRLGIVEENKQVMAGEEMSVYVTPPH